MTQDVRITASTLPDWATEETLTQIRDLAKTGVQLDKEAGVRGKKKKKEAEKLYRQGFSLREIAQQFNLKYYWIQKFFKEHGIKTRSPYHRTSLHRDKMSKKYQGKFLLEKHPNWKGPQSFLKM